MISKPAGPFAFAPSFTSNNGRTPTSASAGHKVRFKVRVTVRPPLS